MRIEKECQWRLCLTQGTEGALMAILNFEGQLIPLIASKVNIVPNLVFDFCSSFELFFPIDILTFCVNLNTANMAEGK